MLMRTVTKIVAAVSVAAATFSLSYVSAATLGSVTSTQIVQPKAGLPTATAGAPYGSTVATLTQTDAFSGGGTKPLDGTKLSTPNNVVWDASPSLNQSGGVITASAPGNGVGLVRWVPTSSSVTLTFANVRGASPTSAGNGCGIVLHADGSPAAGTGEGNAILVDRVAGTNLAQLSYGTFSATTFTPLASSSTFTVANTGTVTLTYTTSGTYTVTTTLGLAGTWTVGVPHNIVGGYAGVACFADPATQVNAYTATTV